MQNDLNELSRNQITQAAVNYLGLKSKNFIYPTTSEAMFHCPWHKDKTPSLGIDFNQGIYHCFSCGRSGSIETMFRELTGSDLYKVLGLKTDPFSSYARATVYKYSFDNEDYTKLPSIHINYDSTVIKPAWEVPDCQAYIKSRGITEEVARYFQFGYCENLKINSTSFKKRLLIPIYEDNSLISIEGRRIYNTEDIKVLYPRNCSVNSLMDIDNLDKAQPCFAVEGLMDLCVLRTCDTFKNSTSIFGANLTKRQLWLISQFKQFIYIPDSDAAGDKTVETLKESGLDNLYILKLPSTFKGYSLKDVGDLPKAGATPEDLVSRKWLSYIKKL